jgi:hypothetical protein
VIPAASAVCKYLQVLNMNMAISGMTAICLDFEGIKCPSALNSSNVVHPRPTLEEAGEFCCFIANSYVYSLFGVAAGIALLLLSASKRTKSPRSR